MASAVSSGRVFCEMYSGVLQYLPILNAPAVRRDECGVDEALILARAISGVALAVIAMAALHWTCPAVALFIAKYETLAVLLPSIGVAALYMIENVRAHNAADRLAVEEYKKQCPSSRATDRLCASPRAFQYLLDAKEDLNKVDSENVSLTQKILASFQSAPKVRRMLIDVRKELLNQADIWKNVVPRHIEVLCQHGFNINARDVEGETPLMHWAKRRKWLHVIAALRANANPLLENREGKKASQLVSLESSGDSRLPLTPRARNYLRSSFEEGDRKAGIALRALLEQAEREVRTPPVLLPKQSWTARLLWQPLISTDNGSYDVDDKALMRCVCFVYAAAIVLLSALPYLMTRWIETSRCFYGFLISPIFLVPIACWGSEKEAQRQAVVEYLTRAIPSPDATATICNSVAAARLLATFSPEPRYFDKLNEDGASLLSKLCARRGAVSDAIFKLLVDKGAHVLGLWRSAHFSDDRIDLDRLKYVLQKKPNLKSEIDPEGQIRIWSSIESEQAAELLKQYGFDPNTQDNSGNTALMLLAQKQEYEADINLDKIKVLVKAGASLSLTNNNSQTVIDLAKNPKIREILQLPQQAAEEESKLGYPILSNRY